MKPYRTRGAKGIQRRPPPNWNDLWRRLKVVYQEAGWDRQVAVLDNYATSKEVICRKFGVISQADVNRIHAEIKSRQV